MPENEEQKQPDIDWTRNPAYRSIYANQAQFASTAFDFSVTLGEIVDVAADGSRIKVEQQAKFIMSPLHFKIFVATAAANIKNYEEKFGKISVPMEGQNKVEQTLGENKPEVIK